MKIKKETRRKLAWAGIIFLAGLYVVDLVLALVGSPAAAMWLKISLFLTIVLPILLWIFLVLIGKTSWQEEQVRGKARPEEDADGENSQEE